MANYQLNCEKAPCTRQFYLTAASGVVVTYPYPDLLKYSHIEAKCPGCQSTWPLLWPMDELVAFSKIPTPPRVRLDMEVPDEVKDLVDQAANRASVEARRAALAAQPVKTAAERAEEARAAAEAGEDESFQKVLAALANEPTPVLSMAVKLARLSVRKKDAGFVKEDLAELQSLRGDIVLALHEERVPDDKLGDYVPAPLNELIDALRDPIQGDVDPATAERKLKQASQILYDHKYLNAIPQAPPEEPAEAA